MVDGLGPVRAVFGFPRGAVRLVGRARSDPTTFGRPSRRAFGQPSADPAGDSAHRAARLDREHVIGDPIEERTVVTREDERAGPVVEEVLEGAERVEVEVVGRLVEDQQVRLSCEHHDQLQAPLLPTREHADRRVLRGGVEPELLEQRLVLVVGLAQRTGHQLAHRDVGIERRRVLIGVSDDDRRARRDRSHRGRLVDRR